MKALKQLIGVLLLPSCAACAMTLAHILHIVRPGSAADIPMTTWWLAGGFALWMLLFAAFPRPVRTYVFAHELTHVLWAWLLGARVSGFKVTGTGGSVRVDKSHFLITLAPYFFPLYTMLTILLRALLAVFFDVRAYDPFWAGCVGLTWAFHLTFTVRMLMTHQPDIREHGHVFSYAVICLFNAAGLMVWMTAVAPIETAAVLHRLTDDHLRLYGALGTLLAEAARASRAALQ